MRGSEYHIHLIVCLQKGPWALPLFSTVIPTFEVLHFVISEGQIKGDDIRRGISNLWRGTVLWGRA
jgi:hypothetical protein